MSISALFNFKKKSLKLTEPTTTLKGQYLGNVSTNVAKGEKCTDRPLALLWTNYVKTTGKQTVAMKITVDNSGLKVYTTNQGLTHYWCHRISHFCVPKTNDKLFVWIYRHVGKKLKVELRCHAILLTREKKAKSLVDLLTDKVAASLQEYRREKTLKHRRRLLDVKAAAHLSQHGESPAQARTKLLATSKNYKPPTEYSLTTPTLTAISEEADCSSSEESDYNGSPYSTLGRWTFKNKFNKADNVPTTPDVNMNQLRDNGECEHIDYSDVSGFATLPRQHRPHSKRRMQKKLLVDRLETLVMHSTAHPQLDFQMSDSEDDYEVEAGSDDEDGDSGAGSQSLSGAEVSPVTPRLASTNDVVPASYTPPIIVNGADNNLREFDDGSIGSLSDEDESLTKHPHPHLHPPNIAHIRSFSDGFYSFDKSSLSSEGSEISIDRQKVFQHSNNHVSSESGVGEDIGSTETLSKADNDDVAITTSTKNVIAKESSDIVTPKLNGHMNGGSAISNSADGYHAESKQGENQLPATYIHTKKYGSMFYKPTDCKDKIETNSQLVLTNTAKSNDANNSNTPLMPPSPSATPDSEKGFESDCSDSSVEIIRIITRL